MEKENIDKIENIEREAPLCLCGCGHETKIITHTNHKLGRIRGRYNNYICGHCKIKPPFTEEHKQNISKTKKRLILEGKIIPSMTGKHHSEETRRKIGLGNLGKIVSEETRKKQSIAFKLIDNSGRFRKGDIPNNKGKTYKELYGEERAKDIIEKSRIAKIGNVVSTETRKKLSKASKGKKKSEEHKRKIGEANKISLKGRRLTDEWKNNIAIGVSKVIISGEKKIVSGKEHPHWLGGKSFEPYTYEFNYKLKDTIKKSDNYHCIECNIPESVHITIYKKRLAIHHIDYNKRNNSQFNLITLCIPCHAKTNFDRKHWEQYFKMKVFIRELFNPKTILEFQDNKLIGIEVLR